MNFRTRKEEKDFYARYRRKMQRREGSRSGRYFLDQNDLGEARWNEAVEHARARREGRKIAGVVHHAWGCGCCFTAHPKPQTDARLPKHSKEDSRKERSRRATAPKSAFYSREIVRRDSLPF